MSKKAWLLPLLLLVLFSAPALAAVTVTMTTPVTGTRYNNTSQNVQTIDINFTVTDNNANVQDLNVNILYHIAGVVKESGSVTYIVQDANIYDYNANPTSTASCVGLSWASFTCNYRWAMPNSLNLAEGNYILDVNVIDWTRDSDAASGFEFFNADQNGTIAFAIDNKLSNIEAVKSLLADNILVLIGAVLIALLAGIIVVREGIGAGDWSTVAIAALIMTAIAAIIMGVVLTAM